MQTLARAVRYALVAASFGTVVTVSAETLPQVNVDVRPQPLNSALNDWAMQTGWQYVMRPSSEDTRWVPRVAGSFTAPQALERLLEHAELNYEQVDERTMSLRDGASLAMADESAATFASLSPLWLANAVAPTPPTVEKPSITALDEIVVTGTRLRSSDDDAVPLTVFDRQRLDDIGASTVAEVLRYLPQQPFIRADGFSQTDSQYAQLRGLGLDFTLVLINGRRTVPGAASIAFNAFDLNTLPLAAVERIEVLSDSASAVYGADAVGGVVNVILKKAIDRPVIDLRVGSARGGAEEREASFALGHDGERVRGSIVVDWFDRESLLGRERDRFANQDFRRFGGDDLRAPQTNPGNVSSRTAANLPGLTSTTAAIADGSSGLGLTPSDLLAAETHLDSLNRFMTIVPSAERRSAAAFGEVDFTSTLRAFVELMYVDRTSEYQFAPSVLTNRLVPASNAFNPFGVAVNANYLMEGLGPRITTTESELARGASGLRGTLGTWDFEVAGLLTRETAESVVTNTADTARVTAALASTDPALALNVFQDGPGASAAVLESLKLTRVNEYESRGRLVNAFARGALVTLPAGPLQTVIGGEWQRADMEQRDNFQVTADREAWASFLELQLPLASADMQITGLRSLSLTGAVRFDHYSDFGDTLNPQFGVSWVPVEGLLLRGSYGTSFRPPSLFELYAPRTIRPQTVNDPRRGNELVNTTSIAGGNPDLEPIEARSWSGGVVLTPASLPGFRAAASYWHIDVDQRVAAFAPNLLLANEAAYPERVQREAPSPLDVAAGRPGALTLVDISRINFGSLKTSGVDLELSYAMSTAYGDITPSVSGTWVERYETVDLPGAAPVDRVDVASSIATIAQWRVIGALTWRRSGLGASVNARYTPAYEDAKLLTRQLTGREVDAQTLVDVQASLDLGAWLGEERWWARHFKITAGAMNVFDDEPPFAEIGLDAGYDPAQSELKGRFVYLNVSKGL